MERDRNGLGKHAPDAAERGNWSKPDFVGWTGLPPISVLLERRFGLRQRVHERTLVWDIRPLEAFGVRCYPFGEIDLDLSCKARTHAEERPNITVRSSGCLTMDLRWRGGRESILIEPS